MLPIAILLLFLALGLIASTYTIVRDYINASNNTNLSSIAEREAENALVYGVYASNTKDTDAPNGKKCVWHPSTTGLTNVSDEDNGLQQTVDGYKIKRFINYNQSGYASKSNTEATLVGMAKIYKNVGGIDIKVAEKAVAMDVSFVSTVDDSLSDDCDTNVIKMDKKSIRNVN